ncbi:CLUMA_CG016233, isoform A [Clunio marinus]|uniref:ATP-dependent RNA helicase n=1 Tax=Clunio marinus TaxID=568069 RepID=A0A1J1IUT5_9DIPT|nr:CLUMA_CG016233, isoform A [Clunio marinus]
MVKNKQTVKKISSSKWKPVEISGNLIGEAGDFDGFAGLEVLENYDSSFLRNSKQNLEFSSSELDGDVFDIRKRKHDSDDEEITLEKAPPKKKANKKKHAEEINDNEHFPGKFVLLKPSNEENVEENSEIRNVWNEIGVLSDEIIKSLTEMNFTNPTEIQRVSIPVSVYGKCDILGAAPTGSGKTLAFGIPIVQSIQRILSDNEEESDELFSIILTPTRELAQQIHKHLKAIAKYTNVTIACIIGGLATVKQERILKSNPHIVIGTPGRVWELIQDGNEHLQKLKTLKYFVVDETDRMIEKGHFAELQEILQMLNSSDDTQKRQNFVFSATLTMVHELPEYLRKKKKQKSLKASKDQRLNDFISMFGMKNPKVFDISSQSGVAEKLFEARILCSLDEKDFYLYYILVNYPGRTIVFCNSIECVKRNSSVLSHLNITPIVLHGKMEQKHRLKSLEKFQKDENSILLSTQVAARGLDIPNIQHVIHYQVPTTGEDYVHRSGRTARADKEGLSILLIEPGEVKFFVKLQKTLGRNEDLPIFPIDPRIMKNVRDRVRLAREIEALDLQVRRQNDNRNWKKKAADDIGILDDSDDDSESELRTNQFQKQSNLMMKQKKLALGKLLAMEIVPNNIESLKFPISSSNDLVKFETNSIETVKSLLSSEKQKKKNGGIKLFRKKKH